MILPKESTGIILMLLLFSFSHLSYAQSLMNVLKGDTETAAFARALEDTGLDKQLKGAGPYTVLAPSNKAFNEFSVGISNNSPTMKNILLNHIMTGLATERSIRAMNKATSLGGITLNIEYDNDAIMVNDARLIHTNVRAGNGVIHVIDRVLN